MADKKALLLRIPQDLWDQLNLWARDDLRSLNAQIEFLLRESVRKRSGKPPAKLDEPSDPQKGVS
jgi:hypothetical protein